MKIKEAQQFMVADEEETLVSPRFDEEETLVARRVVPLDAVGQGAHATPLEAPPAHTPPRRPRVLALAFVSALVGGVLGGAGLHFYQSRSSSNPSPAANAPERANAPAEITQPAQAAPQPAPTAEASGDSTAPAGQQDAAAGESASQAADESKVEDNAGAKETGQSPAADVRDSSVEDVRGGARKHGKKGEHDEEVQRLGRRADPDRQPSSSETDAASGDRKPHRVDSIFERPRRASERDHARRERSHSVDSIRGIFEGQPQ
ncbi:MAG: hypothetical protein DMF67_06755 [Acidobacteria bacterium]|nr:MAG: hypothetical protein DMF67_06755 [Acidobacteriota bacterium]